MKKLLSVLVIDLLIVLFGACTTPPIAMTEDKEPIELTTQEILQKSAAAYRNL